MKDRLGAAGEIAGILGLLQSLSLQRLELRALQLQPSECWKKIASFSETHPGASNLRLSALRHARSFRLLLEYETTTQTRDGEDDPSIYIYFTGSTKVVSTMITMGR